MRGCALQRLQAITSSCEHTETALPSSNGVLVSDVLPPQQAVAAAAAHSVTGSNCLSTAAVDTAGCTAAAAHLCALDGCQHIIHCHAPVQLATWHVVVQHLRR